MMTAEDSRATESGRRYGRHEALRVAIEQARAQGVPVFNATAEALRSGNHFDDAFDYAMAGLTLRRGSIPVFEPTSAAPLYWISDCTLADIDKHVDEWEAKLDASGWTRAERANLDNAIAWRNALDAAADDAFRSVLLAWGWVAAAIVTAVGIVS